MMGADRSQGGDRDQQGDRQATLDRVARAAPKNAGGPPPVHLWNPPFSGDLDMRIRPDGVWLYQGTPINREPLKRLFGRILRKDDDGETYLVTPVEKFRIAVDDAPFVGVDVDAEGEGDSQRITVETDHADRVTLGPEHPLRVAFDDATGQPAPYILVRGRLEARLDRKSFFRLADLAIEAPGKSQTALGVWSGGVFFELSADGGS